MATSPCYPATSALWAGEPRGDLMGVRDWEVGRSEGHPVMGWIGVQALPRLERVLTSDGCLTAREAMTETDEISWHRVA